MYAGEAAKALEGFDQVLSQAPHDPTLHFNMALCREKLGDMDGAAKSYELAIRYGSPQTEQFAFAKKRVVELRR